MEREGCVMVLVLTGLRCIASVQEKLCDRTRNRCKIWNCCQFS